ncbi:hypothetical protein ANN_05843 [Periplaneta americana]|uniref:Endonuclease/exonuclease/phosphatase domain-containing protein n=1 Tax=Periplaneta americana TaxID=6978 RepID=A0ABQ8TC21_PERAM|nr:hypothetical protein ANN_05843 [Periplaneta americana]
MRSRGQPMRGGPPAWGLGEGLTTLHRKKQLVTNPSNKPRNGTDSLARPQQRNKVLRFGTWNVTSLYRTGGVTLVAKELARYRIDFVGVQEGRWCDIVVINAHAPTEEKDDHIKDRFYEGLEQTFDQLPRYHMKILLGDFNAKVGREDIFKPTIGKKSLHISSNDNGVSPRRAKTDQLLASRPHAEAEMDDHPTRMEVSCEVKTCKYLGATVTNINETREEIKALSSSSLPSKSLKVRIYKTVILPVVVYGCETWTLTLREEQRLRVFENKVLRKIFGAKRDEVTGEWRKLHNAELYSSPDIIRNIKSRCLRWAGHVARMGKFIHTYRVLVGRPEGKRYLGRPRRRWEDNIKMDLREVGYEDRDWINLAQDRDRWRAYVNLKSQGEEEEEEEEEEKNKEKRQRLGSKRAFACHTARVTLQKRAKKAQPPAFTVERAEASGENRDAT